MDISLTPELEKFVQDQVKSGSYHSMSAVIHEGLRLLQERDQVYQIQLAELRREVQAGVESGEATPLNMAEIKEMAKQRRQQRQGH